MKLIFILFIVLLCASASFSQTNSVELKTSGGTVLSQHSSVQEAYNAIPGALTQAYVIEILASYTGTSETFPINFTNRTGGSSTNTITLRPAAGNTGEAISGSSNTGILVLNNADYVIIDGRPGGTGNGLGLRIQNIITTGTNSNTIEFVNGSSYNVIRYCHIQNATQTSSGPRSIEIGAGSAANSNNSILNCKIEGGRSGIGFDGTAGLPNDSTTIRGCEIVNFGYAGIWLFANATNINIDSCEIYQTAGVNNTLNTGINIGASVGGTINIRQNRIHDIQSTSTSTSNTARGIWFQTASGAPAGSVWNIWNNFISLPLSNGSAQNTHGIDVSGTNGFTVNCYYNTIRIGGTQTGGSGLVSSGIRGNGAAVTFNVKNNILINKRTGGGGIHAGGAYIVTGGTMDINYNCYFADGAGGASAVWGSTGYTVLADYKTAAAPHETNSIFKDVTFVSATDLHLAGGSVGDNQLRATPIAGITTDIDGQVRSASSPYKGADEGSILLAVGNENMTAESYSLSQNYPNPFNPSTSISFTIPEAGLVTLKIYNGAGKEVGVLMNSTLTRGAYSLQFNGAELSSGVYFYTLTANGFTQTKKMLLVK